MKFLADEDFPKNKPKNLQAVIFHFPKVPTSEIIPLIENFLKDLEQIKMSKGKTLKYSKSGLEEQI